MYVCLYVCVCCASVGLHNKLHKLYGTYIRIKKCSSITLCMNYLSIGIPIVSIKYSSP